ncbi:MAG: methyltransferase domain-containing protein, partial [Bdellovibrionales bacterium]|nr:methyltransferase domain-containing protein [Bdellovibrionales bacterium]
SDDDSGELFLRIRRGPTSTWQVLLRLGKRPLSVREWRKHDMRGALNACIAAAIIELSGPVEQQRVLNICCGSGTLLVECALSHRPSQLVGIDIDPDAIAIAKENALCAGCADRITFDCMDATQIDSALYSRFNVILADLPWGEAIGKRSNNLNLYRQILREMILASTSAAKIAVLTQDKKSFLLALEDYRDQLALKDHRKISQRGFWPTLFLLAKD